MMPKSWVSLYGYLAGIPLLIVAPLGGLLALAGLAVGSGSLTRLGVLVGSWALAWSLLLVLFLWIRQGAYPAVVVVIVVLLALYWWVL